MNGSPETLIPPRRSEWPRRATALPPGPGAPVFFYPNGARRHVNAGGGSCPSPLPSLFPLPPLFPAALAMARACGPSSGPQEACRGPGSTAQGAGEAGAWPWPLLPLPRCPSCPCRSTGAGWGVLIRGAQGEEGLVRATSRPARARACDLCPALRESLGSLGESPLHAKRQRRGVDGSRPP